MRNIRRSYKCRLACTIREGGVSEGCLHEGCMAAYLHASSADLPCSKTLLTSSTAWSFEMNSHTPSDAMIR